MADDSYAPFVTLAQRLADASAAETRRYFRTPLPIEDKPDASPVTQADRAAESAMRSILEAERPQDGIVGEEFGSHGADRENVWIIDPIDGTLAFLTGRPTFATLLALMHRERFVLGLIDQPIAGDRWLGVTGKPTLYGNVRPVATRACTSLDKAMVSSTSPDLFTLEDRRRFDALRDRARGVTYGGDAYGYGLLANGFIDLIVEAQLQLHDFAALVPVVAGAGGLITDWAGRPLEPGADGRILAAGTAALHRQALPLLA